MADSPGCSRFQAVPFLLKNFTAREAPTQTAFVQPWQVQMSFLIKGIA